MATAAGSRSASLWKVHSAALVAMLVYSTSYIAAKATVTKGVHPLVFVTYKNVIALTFLAPWAFFTERGKRPPLNSTTVAMIALQGFFGTFGGQFVLTYGLLLAPLSLNGLIAISVPVFVFIISAATGLELIQWRQLSGQAKVGGVMSTLLGSIFMTLYEGPLILGHAPTPPRLTNTLPPSRMQLDFRRDFASHLLHTEIKAWQLGGILLILSGFLFAIRSTLMAQTLKTYPLPMSLGAFGNGFGAILLTVMAVLFFPKPSYWEIPESSTIFVTVYAGVIAGGINTALNIWVIFHGGPVLASSYTPLQTFTTTMMGCLFLDDNIHLGSILGTLLIINGLGLVTWGKIHSDLATPLVEDVQNCSSVSNTVRDSNLEDPLLRYHSD